MNILNKIKNTYNDYSSSERGIIEDRIILMISFIILCTTLWLCVVFPNIAISIILLSILLMFLWGLYVFMKPIIKLLKDSFK